MADPLQGLMDRDRSWLLLTEFTKSDSLRKHALAVEAAMRAYAASYDQDPETWGAAGMLHDFDYEMHPAAPQHPMKGAEILMARGAPPEVVYAILAHADYSGSGSVKKKLKDKGFARTVNRLDVYRGALELGVDLDEHIGFVIAALTAVAPSIGLAGTPS